MKRNPRKVKWTVLYRRKHKKGIEEEAIKKRTRRTVKANRAVVGASIAEIMAKRNMKPEVRKAQREQAIKWVSLEIQKLFLDLIHSYFHFLEPPRSKRRRRQPTRSRSWKNQKQNRSQLRNNKKLLHESVERDKHVFKIFHLKWRNFE